jgi:hypothetical protein
MLVCVPLRAERVHVISTDGPGALTRYLATIGLNRPRATLDQVNAVSWAVVLRGDDRFRVLRDANRKGIEIVSMRNAVALMFGAAASYARRKNKPGRRGARDVGDARARRTGPQSIQDLFAHRIFNAPAPAGAEQPR